MSAMAPKCWRATWQNENHLNLGGRIGKVLGKPWKTLKNSCESADGKDEVMQIILIVPRRKVQSVLKEMHDGTSGGHLGVNKTLDKIRKWFYWLHLCYDVEEWVQTCEICAATKGPQTRSRGKMRQYNVGLPFERIGIDFAGPCLLYTSRCV